MQNTIENVAIRELAGDEQQAMELHMSILAHKELAAQHLVEFCRGLKEMRDGEGYRALGYERFEEYTEAMVDIKGRQAYYYISTYERLGAAVLSENAGLGITKLRLLAEVTAMDRGEFIAENDLDGMTVDEVRAAILERNGLREQLSLLEEAETPPVDVDAIKAEAVAAANAEAAKKQDKLVKDAIKEGEARAKNGYAGELAKAREAAAAEAREEARREMDAQLAVERQEKEEAAARAAQLEQQLNLTASGEATAFALHFDAGQQHFEKCLEIANALKAKGMEEEAEKFRAARKQGLLMLAEG